MSILESIRTFICKCPFLKDGAINIDYLGSKPLEYTIDGVPTSEVVRRYTDGGKIKQYIFIFASRECYGEDVWGNLENSKFYEDFSKWLEEQSKSGVLPVMESGKHPQKIEALSTGYMFDNAANNARYQIQCRLTYYED